MFLRFEVEAQCLMLLKTVQWEFQLCFIFNLSFMKKVSRGRSSETEKGTGGNDFKRKRDT